MSAPMDISGGGKESEVKPDALDQFIIGMARKPLHAIHPRRSNRTITLWKGAVTVKTDDTLPTVFRVMNEENILGCPVTTASGRFYAFIDIKDLVTFTVGMFAKDEKAISQEAIGAFFQKEEKFKTTTVKDLLDVLHPNTNWKELRNELSIPRDMSLLSAFESVVRRGVKRLAVTDDNNQIHSVCTESMLVGWCYNNIDTTLKAIRDVKIGSIAKERLIHSMREDEPVITGFRKMLQANVSGIAVLDKSGDLSDVLSLRDLRGITPTAEDLIRLWRPVSQYKFEIRSKFPKQSPIFPDMYLTMDDTLKTAIVTFDEERVHRLFVVKSTMDKKVVGVFSQSDALRYVLHTASGPLWGEDESSSAAGGAAAAAPATSTSAPPAATSGVSPMAVDAATASQQGTATAQPTLAPEMASAGGAVPITRS